MAPKRSTEGTSASSGKAPHGKRKKPREKQVETISEHSNSLSVAITKYASRDEILGLLPELTRMRLDHLVKLTWQLKDSAMCREFLDHIQGSRIFPDDHRVRKVDWDSKETFAQVYKLPSKGVPPGSVDDQSHQQYFKKSTLKRDGYFLKDCKNDTLRKLLRVLNPIFSPERWNQVKKKTVAAVVKAWQCPDFDIDWASFLHAKFKQLTKNLDCETKRCFLSPYLFHAYDHLDSLTRTEHGYFKCISEGPNRDAEPSGLVESEQRGSELPGAQCALTATSGDGAAGETSAHMANWMAQRNRNDNSLLTGLESAPSHDGFTLALLDSRLHPQQSGTHFNEEGTGFPQQVVIKQPSAERPQTQHASTTSVWDAAGEIDAQLANRLPQRNDDDNSTELEYNSNNGEDTLSASTNAELFKKTMAHTHTADGRPNSKSGHGIVSTIVDDVAKSLLNPFESPAVNEELTGFPRGPDDALQTHAGTTPDHFVMSETPQQSTQPAHRAIVPYPVPSIASQSTDLASDAREIGKLIDVGSFSRAQLYNEIMPDIYSQMESVIHSVTQLQRRATTWMEEGRQKEEQVDTQTQNLLKRLEAEATRKGAEITILQARNSTLSDKLANEQKCSEIFKQKVERLQEQLNKYEQGITTLEEAHEPEGNHSTEQAEAEELFPDVKAGSLDHQLDLNIGIICRNVAWFTLQVADLGEMKNKIYSHLSSNSCSSQTLEDCDRWYLEKYRVLTARFVDCIKLPLEEVKRIIENNAIIFGGTFFHVDCACQGLIFFNREQVNLVELETKVLSWTTNPSGPLQVELEEDLDQWLLDTFSVEAGRASDDTEAAAEKILKIVSESTGYYQSEVLAVFKGVCHAVKFFRQQRVDLKKFQENILSLRNYSSGLLQRDLDHCFVEWYGVLADRVWKGIQAVFQQLEDAALKSPMDLDSKYSSKYALFPRVYWGLKYFGRQQVNLGQLQTRVFVRETDSARVDGWNHWLLERYTIVAREVEVVEGFLEKVIKASDACYGDNMFSEKSILHAVKRFNQKRRDLEKQFHEKVFLSSPPQGTLEHLLQEHTVLAATVWESVRDALENLYDYDRKWAVKYDIVLFSNAQVYWALVYFRRQLVDIGELQKKVYSSRTNSVNAAEVDDWDHSDTLLDRYNILAAQISEDLSDPFEMLNEVIKYDEWQVVYYIVEYFNQQLVHAKEFLASATNKFLGPSKKGFNQYFLETHFLVPTVWKDLGILDADLFLELNRFCPDLRYSWQKYPLDTPLYRSRLELQLEPECEKLYRAGKYFSLQKRNVQELQKQVLSSRTNPANPDQVNDWEHWLLKKNRDLADRFKKVALGVRGMEKSWDYWLVEKYMDYLEYRLKDLTTQLTMTKEPWIDKCEGLLVELDIQGAKKLWDYSFVLGYIVRLEDWLKDAITEEKMMEESWIVRRFFYGLGGQRQHASTESTWRSNCYNRIPDKFDQMTPRLFISLAALGVIASEDCFDIFSRIVRRNQACVGR